MQPSARDLSLEHCIANVVSKLEVNFHSIQTVRQVLDQLDPSLLSEFPVENVLRALQGCTKPPQHLLEVILSYGAWSPILSAWLLDNFPASAERFLDSNLLHRMIIERLSLFLVFIPCHLKRETAKILSDYRLRVELTPSLLSSVTSLDFDDLEQAEEAESQEGFAIRKKEKRARRKKKPRTGAKQSIALDSKAFQRLNISLPRSATDVEAVSKELLYGLKDTLGNYLSLIQHEFTFVIQETLLGNNLTEVYTPNHDTDVQSTAIADDSALITTSASSAYPLVQPMKAALYFESAAGLGEWRILISTRADRDLRAARRKDAKFFTIIIKKIRELSKGHFSNDNQKRLNKPTVDFPIFEAKMTRDSRLVYQIDCIPEYDDKHEHQVIKIFGVYTHAQIDQRFWDSMGYQLGRKGKQYHDRCTFRNRPYHAGDNVIMPASFPPMEQEEEPAAIPELPKEDLEEIHSLLVLEKFVTLSQELLNSIFADLDVAHIFNVTPREKEIIEHPHSCYVLGRSGTGKTTTMLFKMLGIERAFSLQTDLTAKPRQIFVTQSRVLATRVEEYFSNLLDSLAATKKSTTELKNLASEKKLRQEENGLLYDADDDVTWKAGLPQKFSLLQDKHFPLFLTFDRLAELLEGDIVDDGCGSLTSNVASKRRLVTFDIFSAEYWPHFPQNLTKHLDPALVFSELIGVIEGCEQSLSHPSRYLNQKTYENLSHRTQHVFAKQREVVYALFLVYMKHKRQHNHYDTAERTHRILNSFETTGIPGTKIDYLYVDEAQDNLLIDAMLLRSLCRNPDGLFWAGDTAQTITIGSSFRFDDLKAFLYRLEKRREQKLSKRTGGTAFTQGELRTFQLAINYRSHGGIVRCAHSVIELVTHFWPYAIDVMAPEQGIVDGAKPVFFSGWDTNTVRYEQFLFGDSGDRIEFGARQCILVRDDAARAELRQQVGDIGLILTLYESKGLEFDDVLLYKFFEDSSVELGQWRIVLNLVETGVFKELSVPRFDETHHAGVCNELKFLYVAITRARKNLWIVDCSDKSEPMRTLWTSRGYIQNCTPGTDVPHLAVSSSPEEWERTGRTLFSHRKYLQSMHAFERAGLTREVKIAHTHYLREEARRIQTPNKHSRIAKRNTFSLAAQSFLECARVSRGKEQRVFFHNAADCFEKAGNLIDSTGDYCNAAGAYEEALEHDDAIRLYRKCEMFDQAVGIVKEHRSEVDVALAESVLEVARLFYFKTKALGKAKELFDTVEEQLEYLEENVLLDECHAAVLVGLGRHQEAADVHLAEGRTLDAIHVLLDNKDEPESMRRANSCILHGLWQSVSFAVKITEANHDALEMLGLASKLNISMLSNSERDEVAMFQSIKTSNAEQLRRLGQGFYKRREFIQALLCFDHYFSSFPNITTFTNLEISSVLEDFLAYCQMLRTIASTLEPGDLQFQKLFGFQPSLAESTYHILPKAWISMHLREGRTVDLQFEEDSIIAPSALLVNTLRRLLWQRLNHRIVHENAICRRTQAFNPCLPFIMSDCRRDQCPRQHIPFDTLTQDWIIAQVRMHLQQILVYQVLHSSGQYPPGHFAELRHWIHRLYEALNPPAHYLGSSTTIRLDLIPESSNGMETVKNWCRDILYTRIQVTDRTLLTSIYEAADLFLFIDKSDAAKYIHGAPLLNVFSGYPRYYRSLSNNEDVYVLPELFQSLQASQPVCLSAGILFLKQVVSRQLQLDINILCHLVEFLCGGVILVRVNFNLHNVTLPRSWFVSLLRRFDKPSPIDTSLLDSLLLSTKEILPRSWFVSLLRRFDKPSPIDTSLLDSLLLSTKEILNGLRYGGEAASYMLFENRNLSELPAIRDLFIPRICRAIGLIGYNIPIENLRSRIFDMLRPLKAARPHRAFRRFATARSWCGVAAAVRESTAYSTLDDMVQLCSEERQPQYPPPKYVTRLFFKSSDGLRRLLSSLTMATTKPSLRVDAPAFVPRPMQDDNSPNECGNAAENPAGNEPEVAEIEDPVEQPDADTTDVVDSGSLVTSFANTAAPLTAVVISEEQISVGGRLLKGYRRMVLLRRREKMRSTLDSTCASFFDACLTKSQQMEWPHGSFYRKLYLGLVPHLLVCVNSLQAYAYQAKIKAKKRLLKDERQDLDDLSKKMTELNALTKLTKNLQTLLEPSSVVHTRRDLAELKELAGKVGDLVNQVPSVAEEVRHHLELAIKGIVREKATPVQVPKPTLNTEDDDMEYYD